MKYIVNIITGTTWYTDVRQNMFVYTAYAIQEKLSVLGVIQKIKMNEKGNRKTYG